MGVQTAEATYPIGAVVRATGVGEATLRAWESRFGFPALEREPGGHRRYSAREVEQIRSVQRLRSEGLPLKMAIERTLASEGFEVDSVFARLRRQRPELTAQAIRSSQMGRLSRAVEEETAARAAGGLLVGAFQRESAYRRSERRWRDLTRGGMTSFVLADFARVRAPAAAPCEIPLPDGGPMHSEWVLLCLADGHGACLIGRERPGQNPLDERRIFDGFLSLEPSVVRDAIQVTIGLAGIGAPEIASKAQSLLDRSVDPDPESQLRLSAAITSRFVAALP